MNRSYLFSLEHPSGTPGRIVGLSESGCAIPLIYRILASQNAREAQSILFGGGGKVAITADYAAGVEALAAFFARLPEEYQARAGKVIAFLRDKNNAQAYIHLECAEIFEMEDADLEEQNAALRSWLSGEYLEKDIAAAMERIRAGDGSDVRELGEEYWSNVLALMPAEPDGGERASCRQGGTDGAGGAESVEAEHALICTPEPNTPPGATAANTRKQLGGPATGDGIITAIVKSSREYSGPAQEAQAGGTIRQADLVRHNDGTGDNGTEDADAKWWQKFQDENLNTDSSTEPVFDPKNPGSSRYRNRPVNMAEPELYTQKDTGEECGGFALREGEITALPIEPDDLFELGSKGGESKKVPGWRLFLYESDGGCLCVLDYRRAIRALTFLADYGEKYLIGEKDGYVVTTPLTREELLTILNVVSAAEKAGHGTDEEEADEHHGEEKTADRHSEQETDEHQGEQDATERHGEQSETSLDSSHSLRMIENIHSAPDESETDADGAVEDASRKKKQSHIGYWAEHKVLFLVSWASALFVHCLRSESVSGIAEAARAVGWSVFCFFGSWAAGFALLAVVKIACHYFPRVPKALCTVLAWISVISFVWRMLADIGIGGAGFGEGLIATSSFSLGSLFSALSLYAMYYKEKPPVKKADIHEAEPKLYTEKDTGEAVGVFTLREGEATLLPLHPEKDYCLNTEGHEGEKIKTWRLFLCDSDGEILADLGYKKAVDTLWNLAEFGERFIIRQKKDGIVTSALTSRELRLLAYRAENGALEKARRAVLRLWQNKALVFSLATALSLLALSYFAGWLGFGFLSLRFPIAGQLGYYAALFGVGYFGIRTAVALKEGGYGEKAKSALKNLLRRTGRKLRAFFKSWKVRIALAVLALSFAFFVWWLDFQAGLVLWAVFVVMISILIYAVHAMLSVAGDIIGDKFARDGISFDDSGNVVAEDADGQPDADSEENGGFHIYSADDIETGDMGEQLPNIRRFGKAGTPYGVYSLVAGMAAAVIPLAPKPMFQIPHGDGAIRPVQFWRLFLYDAAGEKLGDIEYYRAVFWLKNLIDDVEVRTLGDGNEYLVFENGLLESELKTLIDFAKDDAETDNAGYEP